MDYRNTISDIFSPRKNSFAVPTYQRAYSWEVGVDEDKHVPQFLTDLKEHPETVSQYRLGHFLFEQDKLDRNRFWVIDGQQRMTTVVIFMSCICWRLKQEPEMDNDANNLFNEYLRNTDGKQKFQTVDYDNNYFSNLIIDQDSDIADTRSRKRIIDARNYFLKQVTDADIATVLSWKRLVENAKITIDKVEDKAEATQIFTFQNDRGKQLTGLEKLKAYLMLQVYLACKTKGTDPNESISFIEKEFEAIYTSLEKIDIVDEDQVLNYHITAFVGLSGTAMERVKQAFGKLLQDEVQKWLKDFAVSLKKSFQYTLKIQETRNRYSHIPDVLHLDTPNSFPLLLKLYYYHQSDKEFDNLIRIVEIILFKCKYTTGNYYSNYLPNRALEYQGDVNALREKLLEYAKKGFKDYWSFDANFVQYLEGDNHYFHLTKYLLWKYENSLRKEVKEQPMLYAEFFNLYGSAKFENTIDHWAPQNPDTVEYEEEFNQKYLHNIGNMVLSTRSRNASDSNDLPSGRSTFSILISRQRLEPFKANWNRENIKKRQEEIVLFAKSYWNPDYLV